MFVEDFQGAIREAKVKRESCFDCPLFDSPIVTFDTNLEEVEPVDVFFIGLNPGREEKEQGKPFVGKAGRELRKYMQWLPEGTTWAISNCILCFTRNEAEIPQANLVQQKCEPMLSKLLTYLPARVYVPLGAKAMAAFGVKGPVLKMSGQVVGGMTPDFIAAQSKIVPLIHPSAIFRPGRGEKSNRELFEEGMRVVVSSL